MPDRHSIVVRIAAGALIPFLVACDESPTDPLAVRTPPGSATMLVAGHGAISSRYSAEVWATEDFAYTTTWGARGASQVPGNALYVWNVTGAPRLIDSVLVTDARTLGDVQVSDDGGLLVVPTELSPGSIVVFDLASPASPRQIARFTSPRITRGVHTCELQRVGGKLYAFLSVNTGTSEPSRLMIVDLSNPATPVEVMYRDMGQPFIHDVFVRDGLLFTALWDDGATIWDIGGGGKGGSVQNPVAIGNVKTKGGFVHNLWWFHDPSSGSKRFLFVGEEGPASGLSSASGDIHVVDVSDLSQPREVAFFSVPGAGAHNFSMDETRGILYAAFYNAGVQVLDVRGDLGTCTAQERAPDGRCDLRAMGRLMSVGLLDRSDPVYVWGVRFTSNAVYASDMLTGLWKLGVVVR